MHGSFMMDKPKRDVSMIVFAAAGEHLISATTALALVRMVIADYYGKSELAAQEPPQGRRWR